MALVWPACGEAPGAKGEGVFNLKEVSAFERGGDSFMRGQSSECKDQPFPEVKAYPAFKSGKPVYGSVRFGGRPDEPESGMLYHWAMDESQGSGKGCDRLYFDLNRDGDLRNDPVRSRQQRPPEGAEVRYSQVKQQAIIEFLDVEFDFGSVGTRPVQLMPRFLITEYDSKQYNQMSFVRTRLYEGEIKVGGEEFKARLGNDHFVSGRLDGPNTALVLVSKDAQQQQARWWGGDRLMAVHKIGGRFYTFAANPVGDELTVRPYDGELGTLAVGPGKRSVEKLAVRGSLQAQERAVAVGDPDSADSWSQKAVRDCPLPVGDYLPAYLSFEFGRLRIGLSQNYHSDGKARDRAGRPLVYGIQIRKEKPFVLDFAAKPEVMFASPAKDQRLKLGEELQVKAVLVDPVLDIMIRDLDDSTRKQTKDANGKALGYERNLSLDPTVLITRANGKKVAEGVMPFG